MLGVVLWSDTNDNKAVIWCEDQGDLAFYDGDPDVLTGRLELDAGDLVHFDLQQERHRRFARNPRRLQQAVFSDVGESLKSAANGVPEPSIAPHVEAANVVAFARRTERCCCDMVAV